MEGEIGPTFGGMVLILDRRKGILYYEDITCKEFWVEQIFGRIALHAYAAFF
jgi:hypothetical protein